MNLETKFVLAFAALCGVMGGIFLVLWLFFGYPFILSPIFYALAIGAYLFADFIDERLYR